MHYNVKFDAHIRLFLKTETKSEALAKLNSQLEEFWNLVLRYTHTDNEHFVEWGGDYYEGDLYEAEIRHQLSDHLVGWVDWALEKFDKVDGGYRCITTMYYEGIEDEFGERYLSELKGLDKGWDDLWMRFGEAGDYMWKFLNNLSNKDFTVFVNKVFWEQPMPKGALIFHLKEITNTRKEIQLVEKTEMLYQPLVKNDENI